MHRSTSCEWRARVWTWLVNRRERVRVKDVMFFVRFVMRNAAAKAIHLECAETLMKFRLGDARQEKKFAD